MEKKVARSERRALWAAALVASSVFGPYVSGNLRLEQFVLIPVFAGVVVFGWPTLTVHRISPLPVLMTWLAIIGVVLIGTFWGTSALSPYGQQSIIHGLGAFATPVMLMTVTWFWTLRADTVSLVRLVAQIVCTAMTVNSIICIIQFAAKNARIFSFLPLFWSGSSGQSVAAASAENGRYTGIFDQPAVSGIAYGLSLLCLIYLARTSARRRWLLIWPIAALMITGGLLALSKTFVFGALPVVALIVARTPQVRLRMTAGVAFAAAAVWFLATIHALPSWPSGVATAKGLTSATSITSQATGGRYGVNGTLGPVVSDVLHFSPLVGFGAGGLNVPYDSLWVESLAVSGLVGLILMLVILILLGVRLSALRGTLGTAERSLAGAAVAIAAIASLGVPSLTSDPAASMLWLIIGLLITAQVRPPGRADNRLGQLSPVAASVAIRCGPASVGGYPQPNDSEEERGSVAQRTGDRDGIE